MKNINIRKIYYHARHRYFTLNNVVVAVAFMIGAGWVWGSVSMMQRNYDLQKRLDAKIRQQKLAELEVATLEYQKKYHQSTEYRELAAREQLGLANPGEKVIILPANTLTAKNEEARLTNSSAGGSSTRVPSNFELWMTFLFGGNTRGLQRE